MESKLTRGAGENTEQFNLDLREVKEKQQNYIYYNRGFLMKHIKRTIIYPINFLKQFSPKLIFFK